MSRRILILVGHPDPSPDRFGGALASAYADAAVKAGHTVKRVDLGAMDVPYLLGQSEFERGQPPAEIRALQQNIEWAEHIVLLFPLWLGGVPAKLKALLEQVFRGGFGFAIGERGWISKLKGRSARLVVTMGMPGPVFRLVFGAHGVKAIEKGILMLAGVRPIRSSIVGGVESIGPAGRARWLARMRALGAKAA